MRSCINFILRAVFLLLCCVFFFSIKTNVYAADIQTSQNVIYKVLDSGKTQVTHSIQLTNLTTNYYASQYTIFLGYDSVENVQAQDGDGKLEVRTAADNGLKGYTITFNQKIVGKGKTLKFTFSYETNEVASHRGRIWEVTIPKMKDNGDLGEYTASVVVPNSFGKALYIKPARLSKDLTFSKEEVMQGVSIAFGEYQLMDYDLSYHLTNQRLFPIVTEIALPPNTSYQDVLLDSLTPEPLDVTLDKDGNWLAKYRVEAGKSLDIKARGKVKLYVVSQKHEILSETDRKLYTSPKNYWDSGNTQIAQKAKELKTPDAIYQYVVHTLTYDYDRVNKSLPRVGAANVLQKPQSAVCMEFTDLFIALARAAGIPAREVDGYAYTQNSKLQPTSLTLSNANDILHAWPEYYDDTKEQWIAVDPTWGNTTGGVDYFYTFDLNHFAFVVRGAESDYPSPAGSYKTPQDREKQDVNVVFSKSNEFLPKVALVLASNIEKQVPAGIPVTQDIQIENTGNSLAQYSKLSLTAADFTPHSQELSFAPLPPYGREHIPFTVKSPSYLDNKESYIVATVANQPFTITVRIMPLFLVYLPYFGGLICVAGLLIIATTAWRLYIQGRIRNNFIRGKGQKP